MIDNVYVLQLFVINIGFFPSYPLYIFSTHLQLYKDTILFIIFDWGYSFMSKTWIQVVYGFSKKSLLLQFMCHTTKLAFTFFFYQHPGVSLK